MWFLESQWQWPRRHQAQNSGRSASGAVAEAIKAPLTPTIAHQGRAYNRAIMARRVIWPGGDGVYHGGVPPVPKIVTHHRRNALGNVAIPLTHRVRRCMRCQNDPRAFGIPFDAGRRIAFFMNAVLYPSRFPPPIHPYVWPHPNYALYGDNLNLDWNPISRSHGGRLLVGVSIGADKLRRARWLQARPFVANWPQGLTNS